MQSANFRIIPHRIAIGIPTPDNDLYRYLITYASADQPRFIALDPNGQAQLIDDEKSATRYPSMEAAQARLSQAIELAELRDEGHVTPDL